MEGMLAFLGEGTWLRDVGLPILLTVVAAVLATLILRVIVRRFQRRLEQAPHLPEAGNLQRAATLAHALSATFVVIVWVLAGMLILNYLDVPLAPFIASAGIAGVALGFGAQSIVKDTLTGFFILLENQFGVADTVEIRTPANPILGRVEWLTLRATALRAYDGTLHIVPNGNIVLVSNKSRGWARAIVDTPIAYGQDPEQVRELLDELFDELRVELRNDPQMKGWVMDGPSVLGIETTEQHGCRHPRRRGDAAVQEGRRRTHPACPHHPASGRARDPLTGAHRSASGRTRSVALPSLGPSGR